MLTFCVLVSFSCSDTNRNEDLIQQDELEIILQEFKFVFPVLNRYNWKIYSGYEGMEDSQLELDSNIGDTTIVVALSKAVTKTEEGTKNCYSMNRFVKTFSDNQFTYRIYLNDGIDTLYFFYTLEKEDNPRNRIFIRGKYAFLYNLGVLDSLESRYYLLHRDSLNKVIGDNLPDLPPN